MAVVSALALWLSLRHAARVARRRWLRSAGTDDARRARPRGSPWRADRARAARHDRCAGTTALIGRNGAGKTTLLRTLAGLLSPAAGGVLWRGRSLADPAHVRTFRTRLGYVPQDLPPTHT